MAQFLPLHEPRIAVSIFSAMSTLRFLCRSWEFILLGLAVLSTAHAESKDTAAEEPAKVEVGIYLNRLYDLNATDGNFSADFWLWFRHREGLKIEPLKSREFVNAIETTTLGSDIETKGNTVWITEKINGKFNHGFDLSKFPNDSHHLRIEIEEANLESSQLKFSADQKNSMVDAAVRRVPGWHVRDFALRVEDHAYGSTFGDPEKEQGSIYQKLIFEITVERDRQGLILRLFSGLYFSVAIAIIALFLKTRSDDIFSCRMAILSGMVFSVLISKDTAEKVVGQTLGSNAVDQLHGIGLVLIFILIAVTLVSRYLTESKRESASIRLDRIALLVIATAFLLANLILI